MGERLLFVVFGGRDYSDRDAVFTNLDRLVSKRGPIAVLQGGAKGADALALEWALSRGMWVKTFHARWKEEGKSAGPKRNERMASHPGLTGAVGFPGGRGTADMASRVEKRSLNVWWPCGRILEPEPDRSALFTELLSQMKPEDADEWKHRVEERIAIIMDGSDIDEVTASQRAHAHCWKQYMEETHPKGM